MASTDTKPAFWILIGSICTYNLSTFSWWAQPEIMHTLIAVGFAQSAAGLIVSVELIAVALTSFVLAPMMGRLSVKSSCYVAGLLAVVCHFASTGADSVEVLVAARFIAGCAEGLILAVANAALASTPNPDRAYGLLATWNVAAAVGLLVVMPPLARAYGQVGVFATLGLACALMMPFIRFLPGDLRVERAPKLQHDRRTVAVVLLASMFIWGTAAAMVWPFVISIGEQTDLDPGVVGLVAAFAATGGLLGGALAAHLGARYGRYKPLVLGMLVQVIAAFALTHIFVDAVFIVAAPTVLGTVYFLLPYFLAVAADYDPGGGLSAAVAGMFVLTGGSGPLLGGYAVGYAGFSAIAWSILVATAVAWLLLHSILSKQSVVA